MTFWKRQSYRETNQDQYLPGDGGRGKDKQAKHKGFQGS